MPHKAQPTRTLRLPLAVFAIAALSASVGCTVPHYGEHGVGTLAHLLGLDGGCGCADGCGCGDCSIDGYANCPPDGRDASDSEGPYCESEGCEPGQGSESGTTTAYDPLHRIAELPCETATCVTSCGTPHACPGPPDVPPPGRFHPVPTQPVFSPRFVPMPYGQAEF